MTPTDETELITPQTKPPRRHSLWHTLTRMRQGIRAQRASAYARAQEWVVELQEVIGRAGREAVIRLQPVTVAIVGRLREPLMWLRFMALLCMLMGGLFRLAEPDTWLGHLFASRYNAAKAGYKTLLQTDPMSVQGVEPRPLTRQDHGFHEILELTLAGELHVQNSLAKGEISPIETITFGGHSPLMKSQGPSTVEHPFRTPFSVSLQDQHGKVVNALLRYTERDIKERFFMPMLRWWATVALWAGFIINVLLPFPSSRKSPQPMREE